jgi:hypothetical protein
MVALLFLLAACSVGEVPAGGTPDASGGGGGGGGGGGDGGGGGGTGGGQSFTMIITPLVDGRCTTCHGGGTAPNLTSFMALEPKYKTKPGESNILVTEADATNGQHHGIAYFSATEKTTVANWINSLP